MRQNYFKVNFIISISCFVLCTLFGQASEGQVESINSFSTFADWCENKNMLDQETIHTIDQLLLVAETDDCKLANKRLNERTKLVLSKKRISSLAPLNSFRNLTHLTLSENQITDIKPLSSLTNLILLRLNNNQIANIQPLEKLTKLIQLGISDNRISDISPLKNLASLTFLAAKRNQISDVKPLKSLINLRQLYLSENRITDISPLSSLKKIGTDGASFSVSRNPIINKTCPFENKFVCGF